MISFPCFPRKREIRSRSSFDSSKGDHMKKIRLMVVGILTTLALSAAACASPTAPDHTLGSSNHTLGSSNHTLGSSNGE